ncbi:MAG: hypothetical protein ACYSRP_03685 [Planctomycetota bacterium]|jgi:hypothetical protein
MAHDRTVNVGVWKMVFMLLITWLTPFAGLGNLLFLWRDHHFRLRAIIALAVTLAIAIPLYHLYTGIFIHVGMNVWMTLDAVAAFKRSEAAKSSGGAAA